MENPSAVEWSILGLTSDQWTQINGVASSITAFTAVLGVALATYAVIISSRSAKAGLEAAALDRRAFLNEQFSTMMSEVFSFGASTDVFVLGLLDEEPEKIENIDAVRSKLPALYAAMNTTKQRIRSFRSLGLPALDASRRKDNGELTLDVALYALEAVVDERYIAADWDSATVDDRNERLPAFPVGATGRDVLMETVNTLVDKLGPVDRTPEVREALQDALEWMWPWEKDEPWRVQRSEYARQAFDMLVDLVQECYAISAHSIAKWASDAPAPDRGWTCRCGIQNADHSSGLCRPKDKRSEFPTVAQLSRG